MSALLDVSLPDGWQIRPFGRVARRSKEAGRSELPPLSVYLEAGVVPRADRDDNHNRLGSDLSAYLHVRPGDIVFNKLRTWQGGVGVSRHEGIVSPAYFVCRPGADVHPRFYHYLLRSSPYLSEMTRLSKFMPPSQFDIAWDDLRAMPVAVPPPYVQAAIADRLDTETARIDALIAKKQRIVELAAERRFAELEQLLWSQPTRRLRFVAELLPGFAFASSDFGPDEAGPRLLRGINVGVGQITRSDEVRLNQRASLGPRYALEVGDVVIGMDRPFIAAGTRVAVVDQSSAGMLLVQRVCRIRPRHVSSAVLAAALGSARFRAYVESDLTGVSVPHLSDEQIGDFPVPIVDDEHVLGEITGLLYAGSTVGNTVDRQLDLLREYRQALITAAVTGQLEISGVA